MVQVFFLFESNITIYDFIGAVNGLILNIHNGLIALDISMTLKMADEVKMDKNLGLPFLHERDLEPRALP